MAETQSKRQREEGENYQCEEEEYNTKRHKSSYDQILSILEEEEEEPNQDLLDIFKSIQDELSSDYTTKLDPLQSAPPSKAESDHQSGGSAVSESCSPSSKEDVEEEDDDRVRMMRHLLEASDDELGLPNRSETNSGDYPFTLGDGMWEFEDDAANYYTLLQSELFM